MNVENEKSSHCVSSQAKPKPSQEDNSARVVRQDEDNRGTKIANSDYMPPYILYILAE